MVNIKKLFEKSSFFIVFLNTKRGIYGMLYRLMIH